MLQLIYHTPKLPIYARDNDEYLIEIKKKVVLVKTLMLCNA